MGKSAPCSCSAMKRATVAARSDVLTGSATAHGRKRARCSRFAGITVDIAAASSGT
nr:hypothetical protein [Demequina sediminis]